MANAFRYVINGCLYNGYWQPMPPENGKKIFRISYPEHAGQFGEFFEVVETGDHYLPFRSEAPEEFGSFYGQIILWFSDYKLLSG
jgi:hypothetical protein